MRDNNIYVGTDDQRIYRLNAETGAVISELALDAKPTGRMAFVNDSLFMFLENVRERVGYIVAVDSKLTGLRWKRGHPLNGHPRVLIYGENPSLPEIVVERWQRSELRMVTPNGISASRGAFGV